MRNGHVAVLFILSLLLVGCGSDTPTGPASCLNLGGTWRMEFSSACGYRRADQVVITQNGCSYSSASTLAPIAFEGTISDKSVSMQIAFLSPCPGTATGTGSITLEGLVGTFQGQMTGGAGCRTGAIDGTFTILPPL